MSQKSHLREYQRGKVRKMEEKALQADVGFEKLTLSYATVYRANHFRGRANVKAQGSISLACSRPNVWVIKRQTSSRRGC